MGTVLDAGVEWGRGREVEMKEGGQEVEIAGVKQAQMYSLFLNISFSSREYAHIHR